MAKVKNPEEGKRSARINLALPVKLAEDLKTLAFLDGGNSVNDYVKRILAAYVAACDDDLERYKNFREQIQNEKLTAGEFSVFDETLKVGYLKVNRSRFINELAADDTSKN